MKIYTRKGDEGETGLLGGERVSKDSPRVEACGTVDELNAALGLARAEPLSEDLDRLLERLQHELFRLGAELASGGSFSRSLGMISADHVEALEQEIDRREASLSALRQFILPGGTRAAAALHVARTVCRRAERRLVAAIHAVGEDISPTTLVYLNRLGDLLFVLARSANAQAGQLDIPWQQPSGSGG
jgi:cob(I)alamin adenosyltransferase